MTSTALTRPWSSSKLRAVWKWLPGLLSLALLAGACSTGPTDIGVGLPDANANTGAYLVDTLTVTASTVLRDSVVTSGSGYLLVGQYKDPYFGKLTARSFFRLGGTFTPESNFIADSAVLILTAQAGTYRYGDTTQTQALVNVYPLNMLLPSNRPLFASRKYTDLSAAYTATPASLLNRRGVVPQRRVRPNNYDIRVPLTQEFADNLMVAGKAGQLRTQDQLQAYLPGLAITPASTDNGALVRLDATSTTAGILYYYHNPNDPSTSLTTTFQISTGGAHCFQVEADRTGTPTETLSTLQALEGKDASLTGYRTYIEGAIGFQTRLRIPYLNELTRLGRNLTITSAQLTAEVPSETLSPYVPTPPALVVRTSNANNQPTGVYLSNVDYTPGVSSTTALYQGSYSFAVTSYVNAVLANAAINNGFLLASATPELPSRVVLGSPGNSRNRLRLRVYVISTN